MTHSDAPFIANINAHMRSVGKFYAWKFEGSVFSILVFEISIKINWNLMINFFDVKTARSEAGCKG